MIDLNAPFEYAIIGIQIDEATRVHFGSVRFTENFAVLHETPGECCDCVVLVPIKIIESVELYPDDAALQKAIADEKIHIFKSGPEPQGMEVR